VWRPRSRGLGDAAVHGQLRELQADEVVVGIEADLPESLHHSKLDPLITPSLRSVLLRAGCVSDPLVGAAEDQNLHQFLEDDPLGDTRAMVSERMVGAVLGQQGGELLLPDGLLFDVWWQRGHGYPPSSGSVETSPDDGTSRARVSCDHDPY
jgi:hypothetical protein